MNWKSTALVAVIATGVIYALIAGGPKDATATDEATVKLFRAQCATCHGADGKGKTTAGKELGVKDWSDGKTIPGMTNAQIEQVIREGRKGDDGKVKMPPFPKLTGDQVKALVGYVRTLK